MLKGVAGKKSWPVRVCRKGDNFYICKRSWPKFVKDHKLKYGDYVLFFLVKKRRFEVITYRADCNRKLDVSSDGESDLSSGSDEGFESSEKEEEDDTYEGDEDGGNSDGDNDDDDDFDPCKRQSSKYANAKDNKKSKGSRCNSGKREKEENENEIEEEEETFDAVRGHYRTDLENPYFVKKLKKSHKTHMIIPNGFAKETNLNSKQNFILHGEDERKWNVKIRLAHGTVFFGEGWTSFFRGYRVKIGDTCKFTLLKDLGNVFTVEIMRQ